MKRYSYLLLVCILFSCNQFEEVKLTERDAQFAIPIFETTTEFSDFFKDAPEGSSVFVDENNVVNMAFEAKPKSELARDVIDPIDLNIPIPFITNPFTLPLPLPAEVALTKSILSGEEIIFFSAITSEEDVYLEFYVEELSMDGEQLIIYDTLRYSGDPNLEGETTALSLEDWELTIPDATITYGYNAMNESGETVVLSSGSLLIRKRLEFKYLEGIWAFNEFASGKDTIYISLYEDFLDGDLEIGDPRIVAKFRNSFGVPVRGVLPIFGIVTVDDVFIPIESPDLDAGINFPYPDINEKGVLKDTSITIDMSNSNVVEVFNSRPKRVEYQLNLIVNADDEEDVFGYIIDTSRLEITVEVVIPIKGKAKDFVAEETFDVDIEADVNLESLELHLYSENEMTLGLDAQIYILKDSIVIDSVFDMPEKVVDAAPVDGDGEGIGASKHTLIVPLSGSRLDNFIDADQLKTRIFFSSSNDGNTNITLRGDQSLYTALGIKFKEQ